MCDTPGHPKDPVLDKLEHMDLKLNSLASSQAQLMAEVFGTGTTKGLSTKVDEIREGTTNVKRDAGKVSVFVSAVTGAILIAVGKILGLDTA